MENGTRPEGWKLFDHARLLKATLEDQLAERARVERFLEACLALEMSAERK